MHHPLVFATLAFLLFPGCRAHAEELVKESVPETGTEGDDTAEMPAASTSTPQGAQAFFPEVQRMLAVVRSSSYSHHSHVDEAEGRFDFDCSGFVSYALSRSYPAVLDALRPAPHKRPLARDFVRMLGSPSTRWESVPVERLAPGDLIAWLKPPEVESRNTGHVLVVRASPEQRAPGEWVVPIVDSASTTHGRNDSRHPAMATGLGTGKIVLLLQDGGPVGYRWSTWAGSLAHRTKVVLARLR